MRYLLSSALLLLVATAGFAQKFEVGVNGGIGFNTAPHNYDNYIGYKTSPSPITLAGSAKVMYNHRKWQFGLEADYLNLSFKLKQPFILFMNQADLLYYNDKQTAVLGKPSVPVKFFVNRKIIFRRLEGYGGLSAGYVFLTHCDVPPLGYVANWQDHGRGFTTGAQLGGTYYLGKHFGVNAEVSGNYMMLNINDTRYDVFSFLPSVGLRYRF